MKKQNIEDIFSSMENFSSIPPPELWSQIEEKLDKPKKKKKAILWWSVAACLLLGLLLPSVLHFNTSSGIKTITNGTVEKNNVVLDEQKNDINTNTIPTLKNKREEITTKTQSVSKEDALSIKNKTNSSNSFQKNQNQKTAVAHIDSKNNSNSDILNSKSNAKKTNINKAVAEKTFVSDPKNRVNSDSQNQLVIATKKVSGQTEKTSIINKANSFNSNSKNQIANREKKASDKILAEKTFSSGKVNPFQSTLKNQVSKSIFEDKVTSKNNNNIAFNSSNLNETKNDWSKNNEKQTTENILAEKQLASNQNSNLKFNDVLNKQDSIQLAELQNLEKGILTPNEKAEKKNKAVSKGEKWAVEVFAGVASSENYKNEKTYGNANDSKQSNSYGVKTKYKINKKWAVGSGLKINELGQSVANVSYFSSKTNAFLTSNDYFNKNETTSAPQITNNPNYVFISSSTTNTLKQNGIQSNNIESGNLDQNLRYIEMPLEVSYSIFNKNKASINLNTGGFVGKLISNNVALDGNSIGENVNANDYVFGSTLSSTIQYRVYKKTNVFVEPAMNYYVNPVTNQSFNQFQWGLNFGLNVSF